MTTPLFDKGSPDEGEPGAETPGGVPRLRTPQRRQVEMHWLSLDELLEPDHRARMVWQAVGGLDLSHWLRNIEAGRLAGAQRNSSAAARALWVYATLDGVGSARRLARLCGEQDGQLGYRWLCGGVTVNHHTLSDFRSQHGAAWSELVTQIAASLMHEGLVTMKQVAREREERVLQAIKNCEELQQQREERSKTSGEAVQEARASTTDPEAAP